MKKIKNFFRKNSNLPKNQNALKHGVFSTVFIVAAVVIVVLVNIFATVMYEKYPIEIDLTQNKVYSLSEENIKYIKSVDQDVTVYVWAKKDEISNGTLESYFQSNFYYLDQTGKYFSQFAKNLEQYSKQNNRIKIEYVDTDSPEASDIKSKFSNDYIYGGDLLVTATVTVNGKQVSRYKHLNSYELFVTEYDSTSGYSKIVASNLENDLSAAINYVTAEKISKFALIKSVGDISVLSNFTANLEQNSFETEEITNLKLLTDEFDGAVIAAPTKDLTEKELDILDSFLDNNGKKGKVLVTFGNPSAAETPNYNDFLSEWGFNYQTGTVVETNDSYYYPGNPYMFFYSPETTEYCTQVSSETYLASADNSPINIVFEQDGQRKTTVLAYSNETSAVRPKNASKNWKPSDNTTPLPLAVAAEDTAADNSAVSTVLAFASTDIASETWTESSAFINTDFLISSVKYATSRDTDSVNFSVNTITTTNIYDQVTESSATFIKIIFVYLLPIACLVVGIVIFIKRKNR